MKKGGLKKTFLTPKSVNNMMNAKVQHYWETPVEDEGRRSMRQKKKVQHTYETVTIAKWIRRQ